MSAQIMDGGPAFPREEMRVTGLAVQPVQPGMTLRDWFAGQVLGGLVSHPQCGDVGANPDVAECLAAEAYAIANAMLAARAKGEA